MSLLTLSRNDIRRVELTPGDVLDAVRGAYRGLAGGVSVNPEKVKLADSETVSYSMLGSTSSTVGFKTSFTHDPDPGRGRKSYYTTLSLYDHRTGTPIALLDGARIGAMRTAAVTALLAVSCVRRGATTLLVIGTGNQGQESMIPLLMALPSVTRVLVAGSHPGGLDAVRARAAEIGRRCEVVDAAEAAPDADLIVAAAGPGTSQLAAGASLRPGATTILVGYGVDADALWLADRVVATDAAQMQITGTDLLAGHDQLRPVDAELPAVVAGTACARRSCTERVFAYNSGLVVTDIAVGELVAARAREQGLGREVELW